MYVFYQTIHRCYNLIISGHTIYSISFASKSEIIVWNESDIEADMYRIGIVESPTVVRRILEPKKKEKNTIFIKGNVKDVVSQLAKLITE